MNKIIDLEIIIQFLNDIRTEENSQKIDDFIENLLLLPLDKKGNLPGIKTYVTKTR